MQRKTWNIQQFNQVNLPDVVGKLTPDIFPKFRGVRYLDMPIHMPQQGWRIPDEIADFSYVIDMIKAHEKQYGDFEADHYVYITIDQKQVEAGRTGRRPGAHSDAYIETKDAQLDITTENAEYIAQEAGEVSHTYILYDCLPTEFFNAPFPLEKTECAASLETFDAIAEKSEVVTYPTHTILKLDPFVVHRCSLCEETTKRTFVKVSISRKQYARQGNTVNPLFDYNWQMSKRSPHERNHPWAA